MSVKKYIYIAIILGFLISIAVVEDVMISSALSEVDVMCEKIQEETNALDSINSPDIMMMVENLEEKWMERESGLCFLVNHKDIADIGVEITRLKSNVATNQIEDFQASLRLIRFYAEAYRHMMGASIHNLF